MKKVYLMNEMLDINNALEKREKEILTIMNTDQYLLCFVKNDDKFSIYRKSRIDFLNSKEEEIEITKQEYEFERELLGNKNIDDLFLKHTFVYEGNKFFNIYGGKYQGLVTLEIFYDDDIDENDYEVINGIDITECDIASDLKLLNMTFDEVQGEIAQLRITGTNLF